MDKYALNNQIVLCRSEVKKSRVYVIRKILKKMKILQSCKNDVVKEKKLKKAEKLYSKMQIIKKLKNDDVTKFALINDDYDVYLKNASENMKTAAMATLAKHFIVRKAVINIRKCFLDWKTELPLLLIKKKEKFSKILSKKSEENKYQNSKNEKNNKNNNQARNHNDFSIESENKHFTKKIISGRNSYLFKATKSKSSTIKKNSVRKPNEEKEVIKEIDDSFFIEKKIKAPKLIKINLLPNDNKKNKLDQKLPKSNSKDPKKYNSNSSIANNSNKLNKFCDRNADVNTLHPSWAAKKLKLIKPFEGKKIKFSDDGFDLN